MERLEAINLFKDFLQKNNIDFNRFLLLNKNFHTGYTYLLFENINDPRNFIIRSFAWSKTQKGYNYWKKLHDKWNELYNRVINKSLFQD